MKERVGTIGIICALLALGVFAAAAAVISCSVEGSNTDDDEEGIGSPAVEVTNTGGYTTVNVTSAPIKDENFLSTITYANIFRQSADTESGKNAGDWQSIGQVERTDPSKLFTAFNFIDYYLSDDTSFFRYCIRYYNGSKYITSSPSDFISPDGTGDVLADATVELAEDEENATEIALLYTRNDDNALYTLELQTDVVVDKTPLSNGSISENLLQTVYAVFDNGSISRPIRIGEATLANDKKSARLAAKDAKIDLQRSVPTNFLDVSLTFKGVIAMYKKPDSGFTKYYWTGLASGTLTWKQFSGSEADPMFEKDNGVITVPSVIYPDITFDNTSLSVAATAAPAFSASIACYDAPASLDLSGL